MITPGDLGLRPVTTRVSAMRDMMACTIMRAKRGGRRGLLTQAVQALRG